MVLVQQQYVLSSGIHLNSNKFLQVVSLEFKYKWLWEQNVPVIWE